MRTGHTFASHSYAENGNFRTECEISRVHHSVEHLLVDCPKYEDARRNHLIPGNIREALGNVPTNTKNVIDFLKDINLYNKM